MGYKQHVVEVQNQSKFQPLFQKSKKKNCFRMTKIFTDLQINKMKYKNHVAKIQNKSNFFPLLQKSNPFPLIFWVKLFKIVEFKKFHQWMAKISLDFQSKQNRVQTPCGRSTIKVKASAISSEIIIFPLLVFGFSYSKLLIS